MVSVGIHEGRSIATCIGFPITFRSVYSRPEILDGLIVLNLILRNS